MSRAISKVHLRTTYTTNKQEFSGRNREQSLGRARSSLVEKRRRVITGSRARACCLPRYSSPIEALFMERSANLRFQIETEINPCKAICVNMSRVMCKTIDISRREPPSISMDSEIALVLEDLHRRWSNDWSAPLSWTDCTRRFRHNYAQWSVRISYVRFIRFNVYFSNLLLRCMCISLTSAASSAKENRPCILFDIHLQIDAY